MIAHRIIEDGEFNKFNLVEAREVCVETENDLKLEGIERRTEQISIKISKGLTNYLLCNVILKFERVE